LGKERKKPKKRKGPKEKKPTWGLCPHTPRIYRFGAKMASKPGGEQKTKPDISFVKKTGHFNLSRTHKSLTARLYAMPARRISTPGLGSAMKGQ
jgi:hypothetical protein